MVLILYHHPLSPCACSVLLTIKALGIEDSVSLQLVDISKGEHLQPEYLAKFPLHTIPSLEHDGFYLWDSHAIATYLERTFGKNDSLYPEDLQKRAKVDQWLHFSNSVLYARFRDMSEPLWLRRSKVVSEVASERAEAAFKMMEDQLANCQDGPWLCGPDMTLADLCCVSQVSAIETLIGDVRHFPRLSVWLEHCRRNVVGYETVVRESQKQHAAHMSTFLSS